MSSADDLIQEEEPPEPTEEKPKTKIKVKQQVGIIREKQANKQGRKKSRFFRNQKDRLKLNNRCLLILSRSISDHHLR